MAICFDFSQKSKESKAICFDCQLRWDNKVLPLAKLVNAKVHRVIWVASK